MTSTFKAIYIYAEETQVKPKTSLIQICYASLFSQTVMVEKRFLDSPCIYDIFHKEFILSP